MSLPPLSVNRLAGPALARLHDEAERLRVAVSRHARGVKLIDAGIAVPGSIEAGLRVAEVCMGGLGEIGLVAGGGTAWPTWLQVRSSQPVLACLASQYAGWSLAATKEETGGKKFFALGSGPARALACKEDLFAELGYRDHAEHGAIVLEVDRAPPDVVIDKLLRDCALAPEGLDVILTPTTSLAGTTQVVARVLEVALHRAHELKFPLEHIIEGWARISAIAFLASRMRTKVLCGWKPSGTVVSSWPRRLSWSSPIAVGMLRRPSTGSSGLPSPAQRPSNQSALLGR